VLLYALTVFCSAFLLFSIQPLMGKFLLPWFGGVPAVWTTCMLFFQCLLVVGYAYSHFLSTRLNPRAQKLVHLSLLLLSTALLLERTWAWSSPLLPAKVKPPGSGEPVGQLIRFLASSVGLSFLVLSATAPLLQRWFSRTHPDQSPYRLYALSNLGSLLALMAYPLLVEPLFSLRVQAVCWTAGYGFFVLLCGFCSVQMTKLLPAGNPLDRVLAVPETRVRNRLRWMDYGFCLALPACTSALLLAVTNQLCQEVAVVPFLWILPLSLYLLSFIFCFESDRIYRRGIFLPAMAAALVLICVVLFQGVKIRIPGQVLLYSLILFSCSMAGHGELSRLKPEPSRLTAFFLMIAVGGALGGVFVGLLAPRIFDGFWELHFGIWLCALLIGLALLRDRDSWMFCLNPGAISILPVAFLGVAAYYFSDDLFSRLPDSVATPFQNPRIRSLLGVLGLAVVLGLLWRATSRMRRPRGAIVVLVLSQGLLGFLFQSRISSYFEGSIWKARSFYGVLVVLDEDRENDLDRRLRLRHGRITHGLQFQEPAKRRLPTTYYGLSSGLGLALQLHPARHPAFNQIGRLRIGAVGLGVGTIAAYALPGDYLRFYEINPDVIRLSLGTPATFSYLKDCPGRVEVVAGDARLTLERELTLGQAQEFDLLAVDAFSSDSIPVHLLTREAMEVYLRHLRRPEGVLAFHITNRFLDLKRVVCQLADQYGMQSRYIASEAVGDLAWESHWMLLAWNSSLLGRPEIIKASTPMLSAARPDRLWTDDYSNLFHVLKW